MYICCLYVLVNACLYIMICYFGAAACAGAWTVLQLHVHHVHVHVASVWLVMVVLGNHARQTSLAYLAFTYAVSASL